MSRTMGVAMTILSIALAQSALALDCPVRFVKCADPDDRSCPPAGRHDLSAIDTPVQYLPIAGETGGMWLGPPMVSPATPRTIVINSTLSLCHQQQSLHHERTHEALYRATGSSWFHH